MQGSYERNIKKTTSDTAETNNAIFAVNGDYYGFRDNVYALFGHGVRSASMSLMFLCPLLGGALIFLLLRLITPDIDSARPYRLGYNLYNSGIAVLTAGSFYKGILDIAGTASEYTKAFMITGWSFVTVGLIMLITASISIHINPVRKNTAIKNRRININGKTSSAK